MITIYAYCFKSKCYTFYNVSCVNLEGKNGHSVLEIAFSTDKKYRII